MSRNGKLLRSGIRSLNCNRYPADAMFENPYRIITFASGSCLPLYWLVESSSDSSAVLANGVGLLSFEYYDCVLVFLSEWRRVASRKILPDEVFTTGWVDIIVENQRGEISVASMIPPSLLYVEHIRGDISWRSSDRPVDRSLIIEASFFSVASAIL